MIELALIGIGTGNPGHLTLEAVRALEAADLVLVPRKPGKDDLADLRRDICAQVLTTSPRIAEFDMPERDPATQGYRQRVEDWHDRIAHIWHDTLRAHLGETGRAALMVWGDPALYDSSLRIAARLPGLSVTVVPGITAIQALTAAHRIPLNEIGGPVLITTGRRLWAEGWPAGAETLVVMLDGDCAFDTLDPEGIHVWWGARLGLPGEALVEGPLADAAPRIRAARADTRARHGWVMDTYLLRRTA